LNSNDGTKTYSYIPYNACLRYCIFKTREKFVVSSFRVILDMEAYGQNSWAGVVGITLDLNRRIFASSILEKEKKANLVSDKEGYIL
jgi:hypothetical protein